MPQTIKKEDGTEETVYTQEELDAERNAAVDEYKAANPVDAAEHERLKADLEKVTKELEAVGSKDRNFAQLRQAKEAVEEALRKSEEKMAAEIGKIRSEMSQTALDAAVRGLAGEDPELAKKVRFHFTETLKGVSGTTPEEFKQKIQQAYLLATGVQPNPAVLSGAMYGSGGAGPGAGSMPAARRGQPLKPELVDMGKRYFGLTEDDFKKYDKQDFSTTK